MYWPWVQRVKSGWKASVCMSTQPHILSSSCLQVIGDVDIISLVCRCHCSLVECCMLLSIRRAFTVTCVVCRHKKRKKVRSSSVERVHKHSRQWYFANLNYDEYIHIYVHIKMSFVSCLLSLIGQALQMSKNGENLNRDWEFKLIKTH